MRKCASTRNTNPQTPKTQSVDGMRRNSEYTVSWHDGVCALCARIPGREKNSGRRRNKKNMKDTTNIRIDIELKQLFESTKDLHHKSIGGGRNRNPYYFDRIE